VWLLHLPATTSVATSGTCLCEWETQFRVLVKPFVEDMSAPVEGNVHCHIHKSSRLESLLSETSNRAHIFALSTFLMSSLILSLSSLKPP